MAHDRKEEKEPTSVTVAKAHEKAEKNAIRLQEAVAFLIYQAETEMAERAGAAVPEVKEVKEEAKEGDIELKAIEQKEILAQERKNNDPPIIHPVTAYGYAAPGGGEFKKLVDKLKTAASDCARDINVEVKPERKGEDPGQDEATKFRELFEQFERDVRDAQNGWMMGQPVEPEVLKSKAKELQAKLTAPEFKDPGVNLEKLQRIKDQLADFPANIDRAIDDWQRKARGRVHSNESVIVHRKMLDLEVKNAKVSELKQELGGCDILRLSAADIQTLKDDKSADFKEFKRLPLNSDSTRAYVLVEDVKGGPGKLVYINKTTKEITEMQMTPQERSGLDAKLNESKRKNITELYTKEEGLGWRSRLRISSEESKLGDDSTHSTLMKPYHEKWIAEIIEKKPDWKKILPCAFGDSAEMEKRALEERECIALCGGNKDKGQQMARDKALERLEASKDKPMEYDVGGEIFRVERKEQKDEEGRSTGRMTFSVTYLSDDHKSLHGSNPAAMAAMVDLCYKYNPLRTVELECEPLGNQTYQVQIKIEQQIEQAIRHAEKLSQGTPPVYIGIELGQNARAALSAVNSNKGLEAKAKALHDLWQKDIAQKQKDKQHQATQKYTAGKEGGLGALLATSAVDGMGVGSAELSARLKTKGNEPEDKDKKFEEVKIEIIKLDKRVDQLSVASQSIQDQIKALERELGKEEVKSSITKLDEIAPQLEGLIAAQKAVALELVKISAKSGIAENYKSWLSDPGVRDVLGVNIEAEKPAILEGKQDQEMQATPEFKAFMKKEAHLKLFGQAGEAGVKAAGIAKESDFNLMAMNKLKSQIEGSQVTLRQQELAEAKAKADASPPAHRA